MSEGFAIFPLERGHCVRQAAFSPRKQRHRLRNVRHLNLMKTTHADVLRHENPRI